MASANDVRRRCTAGEQPLVPLASGRVWRFRYSPLSDAGSMENTCDDANVTVGERVTFDGATGYVYRSLCATSDSFVTGSGDSLFARMIVNQVPSGTDVEWIHSPVEDGESWLGGTITYVWHRVRGSVVVPAGTFTDCWDRSGALDGLPVSTLTYCRSAGLVRGSSPDENWSLELIEKNF